MDYNVALGIYEGSRDCLVILLGIAGELLLRVLDMSNGYKVGITYICLMLKYKLCYNSVIEA